MWTSRSWFGLGPLIHRRFPCQEPADGFIVKVAFTAHGLRHGLLHINRAAIGFESMVHHALGDAERLGRRAVKALCKLQGGPQQLLLAHFLDQAAPVSTTARTAASSRTSATAAAKASRIGWSNALRCSGRFIVKMAIAPARWISIAAMAIVPSTVCAPGRLAQMTPLAINSEIRSSDNPRRPLRMA